MKPATPHRTFPTPDGVGDYVAGRILQRIADARMTKGVFLLGCPTGRTPRPIFAAIAKQLAETQQDMGHVVLVMMDEYLVSGRSGLEYAPAHEPWSCHYFASVEIAQPLNEALPRAQRLRRSSIWFPDPADPAAYEQKIAASGGIDFFLLASGASDGHVAFNPPGSPRDSRTRIIPLSDETRRDNLQTFPAFRELANVPRHGISVGVATITDAKEAAMVVWGAGKKKTLSRILAANRYAADWPATLIHECGLGEIVSDIAASDGPE